MNATQLFRELHYRTEPLLIGNVWNVQSAKIFEKLKFNAIATSSAAVADSLGYKDGENMPFDEYFFIIQRIKSAITIPLSVDLEAGYGHTPTEIVANIKKLHALGVVGINLEDSLVNDEGRKIVDAKVFTERLAVVMDHLRREQVDVFINLRCDAFLLGLSNAREEALRRITLYDKTGIHGIFLPCITDSGDIKECVSSTKLPVNVMCMPKLPSFDTLQSLGVKRISMGNFLHGKVYNEMEKLASTIAGEKSFDSLF